MNHVFISYAKEDGEVAARLHKDLVDEGVQSWIDTEMLLPGVEWKPAIRQAIREARSCILLLSSRSITKRGYVQKEIREALEVLDEYPASEVFIIPARVEPCEVTYQRLADLQWVDLFPSYEEGFGKILRMLRSVENDSTGLSVASESAVKGEEVRTQVNTYSHGEARLAANLLFQRAFERSFPGVRGLQAFDDPRQISLRLHRLLEKTEISRPDGGRVAAIWHWRGGNSAIDSFRELGDGIFLLNQYELRVTRIVACNFGAYYNYFVYLESGPMPPTGLYQYEAGELERRRAEGRKTFEHYGVLGDSTLITPEEYADGAAFIAGNLVDTAGEAELRKRCLDPYNLVIASVGSPINRTDFDYELEQLMDAILAGEVTVEGLAQRIRKLPRVDL